MKFDDIGSCRNFIKEHKGVVGFPVYGNPNYPIQYISEKYSKKFQWNMNKIRIYTLDIEVSAEDGFPNIQAAASDVTAITVHDSSADTYHTWGTGGYIPHDQTKTISVNRTDMSWSSSNLWIIIIIIIIIPIIVLIMVGFVFIVVALAKKFWR